MPQRMRKEILAVHVAVHSQSLSVLYILVSHFFIVPEEQWASIKYSLKHNRIFSPVQHVSNCMYHQ
jgi:hypothetical protein